MGYPNQTQVLEAAKRLTVKEDGSFIRTNGLWHVLMFLRHRACHGGKDQYTFESYDLAESAFDLNGVTLPVPETGRNVYFEPGPTAGNELQKFFRHREGPRQTYLNRIYTGLVGGARRPKLFDASSDYLPTTVNLAADWLKVLRETADNTFILDARTHEFVTWIFRFGIPIQSGQTAHIAEHLGNGKMKQSSSTSLSPVPQEPAQLESELCKFFALPPEKLRALLPQLSRVRPSEWNATSANDLATFGTRLLESFGAGETEAAVPVDLSQLVTAAHAAFQDDAKFRIPQEFLHRFVAALLAKRFVILTGLSGSGKTKLAQAFARWITPPGLAVDPFTPGVKLKAAQSEYTITNANAGIVEFSNEDGTLVALPRVIIEEWADYIQKHSISEDTSGREIRDKVEADSKYSSYLHRIESHYKPAAFALLKARDALCPAFCYAVVPVGADWTSNEHVLGYPDNLNGGYFQQTALKLILHAQKHSLVPHFLILDEMNLSHVERYFADLLSLIESNEETWLHHDDEAKRGVPQRLALPGNLYVVGTVNIDETTYMFSPKVLDRANVLEFRLTADQMDDFLDAPVPVDLSKLSEPATSGAAYGSNFVKASADDYNAELQDDERSQLKAELLLFFRALGQHNAEFGFRVGKEVARFLHFHKLLNGGSLDFRSAMDAQIFQKLLPKLHGSRNKMTPVLWTLAALCREDHAWKAEPDPAKRDQALTLFLSDIRTAVETGNEKFDPAKAAEILRSQGKEAHYPLSFDKIVRMWRILEANGFVSFAEA